MKLTGRAVIPQRRCRYGEVIATPTASPVSKKQLYAAESLALLINRSVPTSSHLNVTIATELH